MFLPLLAVTSNCSGRVLFNVGMRHHSARRHAPLCASYTENQLIFTSPSLTSSRAKSQRQSVLKKKSLPSQPGTFDLVAH